MKPFSAVIFDMDGVIVDSEPMHERAFVEIFEKMGYGQTHGFHFPDYYGRADKTLWEDFIARHKPKETFAELMAWKQRHFLDLLTRESPIFESLPELVAKLGAKYPLAVASGSQHAVIDAVLAMKNLRQHFSAIVSATDVPRGKPAPDIFLHTAQLLKVAPAECWVIEDSVMGVEAARAANMQVIAITNSFPPEKLAHATHVVRNYAEIEQLLLG
jgi:HAD superfamily hydrolase (TIGR01509 family)